MIRFFYNGLKVDKGALVQGSWTVLGGGVLLFRATRYATLPSEVYAAFAVKNDSKSEEDYFDTDRFQIPPEHTQWAEAADACEKALLRLRARHMRRTGQEAGGVLQDLADITKHRRAP